LVREMIDTVPDCTVVAVHPDDYNDHLRDVLGEEFVHTRSIATMMSGCMGHYLRPGGLPPVALVIRHSIPRGEARAGSVSLLKGL
jgi:hypothetical protein